MNEKDPAQEKEVGGVLIERFAQALRAETKFGTGRLRARTRSPQNFEQSYSGVAYGPFKILWVFNGTSKGPYATPEYVLI